MPLFQAIHEILFWARPLYWTGSRYENSVAVYALYMLIRPAGSETARCQRCPRESKRSLFSSLPIAVSTTGSGRVCWLPRLFFGSFVLDNYVPPDCDMNCQCGGIPVVTTAHGQPVYKGGCDVSCCAVLAHIFLLGHSVVLFVYAHGHNNYYYPNRPKRSHGRACDPPPSLSLWRSQPNSVGLWRAQLLYIGVYGSTACSGM